MFRVVTLYIGFILVNDDLVAVALFSMVGVALNASLIIITLLKAQKMSGSKLK